MDRNRAPDAKLVMDMAGSGVKPKIRSGPCFLMVEMSEAAMISDASSHEKRTKPPFPRACW